MNTLGSTVPGPGTIGSALTPVSATSNTMAAAASNVPIAIANGAQVAVPNAPGVSGQLPIAGTIVNGAQVAVPSALGMPGQVSITGTSPATNTFGGTAAAANVGGGNALIPNFSPGNAIGSVSGDAPAGNMTGQSIGSSGVVPMAEVNASSEIAAAASQAPTMADGTNATEGAPGMDANGTGDADRGALSWHSVGVLAAGPGILLALVFLLGPADRKNAAQKAVVSSIARLIGLALLVRFVQLSVPWSGFLFDGCFYSSMNGLAASAGLATSCLLPWFETLGLPVPVSGGGGLRASCVGLGTTASTGVGLALYTGDQICADRFLHLNVALAVVAVLLGFAWLKGEGGGLMGLVATARGG